MITDYHAIYYAHELSRVGGTGVDRLGRALFDACVDLNPHQIEAALFALRSPLSKGVLLADEVGLGKTIEAGLVLCQYWAERRRNILVISPASLRKQWALELSEKFNLPSIVLDAKTYKDQQKLDVPNPFRDKQIIICSMHFAAGRAEELKEIAWDLVVIDEAHKLRNAYRESNRLGQRIRWATEDRKKLLLTATPLQNALLELYGLSTLIDDRLFGDLASFRMQYINYGGDTSGLRDRLRTFCWRSLRSQVIEFVRYTERRLITRPFKPTEQEHRLYEAVSTYLRRDETYALPSGQKHLLILIVRKVLASSPHAVAGTLEIMRDRLLKLKQDVLQDATALELLISGEDIDDDLLDEILEDEEDGLIDDESPTPEIEPEPTKKIDLEKLNAEIEELTDYIRWTRSLGIDTKTRALLKALEIGFSVMEEMGAAKKVVVFTESRRTQNWLKDFLEGNGYAGQVLTFNGTNKDDASGQIYREWCAANKASRGTGSRQVDLRAAIILDEQIQTRMRDTRKMLLEHFDEDVHERLKVNLAGTQENIPGEYLYRLSHPLGEHVLSEAKERPCPPAEVVFDISGNVTRIAVVERLKGRSGWLSLQRLHIESFDFEEYLLFSGMDDAGNNIDQETCEKLFNCNGQARAVQTIPDSAKERLMRDQERHAKATLAKNLEENNRHFSEARDQLDKWAEDMEMAAQKELDDTKRQIRDLQRRSRQAPTIEEQHSLQEEIVGLERKKRTLRERIFDIEDEISEKRDRLVESLEKRLQQKTTVTPVFTIRWSVV